MSAWRLGLVAIGLLSASPALAWGDDGHRLVCQIAYERLDGAAKAKLDAIIASNPNGAQSFAEACTYPDKWRARFKDDPIKARTEHHYINLRRSTLSITSETCGTARPEQGCAFTAITSDFAVLSDHAASANERWRALVFLGHFVGDIHQPLHVSFADDAGGNGLHTRGDCTDLSIDNMHSVWDTCIIRKYIYQRMVKPADFFSDPLFHTVAEELANVPPADESSWLATPRFMWGQFGFARLQ